MVFDNVEQLVIVKNLNLGYVFFFFFFLIFINV